jgi:uncharacterized protein
MLVEQIKNSIKEAMMAKDSIRLETLRLASAAFTNELISKGRKPNSILNDDEALAVIARLAKQRKDSISQFKKGNREDLVKKEEAELLILNTYLPKMMEADEIEKVIRNKKKELNIIDSKQKGILISNVMKDIQGRADGKTVKEIVDSLF